MAAVQDAWALREGRPCGQGGERSGRLLNVGDIGP